MATSIIVEEFGDDCNLYEVFEILKTASQKDITKAYRKLALRYHPDKQRGDDEMKDKATRKFQAVSAIHSILSDTNKRAIYDETGEFSEETISDSTSYQEWREYFTRIFPKVTMNEIEKFEKKFRFSEEERQEVIKYYSESQGDIETILNSVMLSVDEDEDRFKEIIEDEIKKKNIKLYPTWRSYMKTKKNGKELSKAHRKKRDKEAKEAEELLAKIQNKNNGMAPEESIHSLSTHRESNFLSLISSMEQRYGEKINQKSGKRNLKTNDSMPSRKKKKVKTSYEEPSEEEFLAIQERLKSRKS